MKQLFVILLSVFAWSSLAAQGVLLDELAELEGLEEQEEIRRYTVEVIIFAYTEDVAIGSEIFVPEIIEPAEDDVLLGPDGWPLEGPLPDDSIPTFTDAPTVEGSEEQAEEDLFEFTVLPEEEFSLAQTLERLERLDAYEPLMHFGWTQPTIPEEDTPAITLAEFGIPPEGLEGTLTLYLSRYLHLVVDLSLAAEDPDDAEIESYAPFDQPVASYGDQRLQSSFEGDLLEPAVEYAPLVYRITENRILKNGETRYYDHPKFGVIATVSRVEEDETMDDVGGEPALTDTVTE